MTDTINIVNANVHNLKSLSIKIPKNKLIVITGPSGSGKSSLAFDTIYVEGQRRYIESLSSYARQFLFQHQPPDVESITGLSPAIAIDQKTRSKNPRSTVGTITEIYDYLRILFSRLGDFHSPATGEKLYKYTAKSICDDILKSKDGSKIHIISTIDNFNKNHFLSLGFNKVYIDGKVEYLEELDSKKLKKNVDVVIDRFIIKDKVNKRAINSIEQALKFGNGLCKALIGKNVRIYSEFYYCDELKKKYPPLDPKHFSFNSPSGACPQCNGIGISKNFTRKSLIFDENLPLLKGAIPILKKSSFLATMTSCLLEQLKIDPNLPIKNYKKKDIDTIFDGSDKKFKFSFKSESSHFEFTKPYPGIINSLEKKYLETGSDKVRKDLELSMDVATCPLCKGQRLGEVALNTKINDKNIYDFSNSTIKELHKTIKSLKFKGEKKVISEKVLKEIDNRLSFLLNVGLEYLSLNRPANTLSGGESQRIRLATQIGSSLSGVLYVLDEPSIGLHPKDNLKLIETLISLRDIGNTVIVVEHDEEIMRKADHIVDIGPGAGINGGKLIAQGKISDIKKSSKSLTAKYLSSKEAISIPERRVLSKNKIELKGVIENNLKSLNLNIPLNGLICITGVSGSGKSTLINRVMVPAVKAYLNKKSTSTLTKNNYNSLKIPSDIKSVIELDQSPIGRTPHSNPATYTGLFNDIRQLYSNLPESQIRGYKPGRFSFNVKGGRCEVCEGNGVKKIEMHFLPDVYVTCEECGGSRYNDETLSIYYKNKNIDDILNMDISEAASFFKNHKKISRVLNTLDQIGLGYIKLGQSALTLSGGEAQRLKLSKELAKSTRGHCLYVLDEPTTGLHFNDIKILLNSLNNLVENGNTVVVIEHNIDVIKSSDHIIDLGPEGGESGGTIVAEGTPESISKNKKSHTGKFLKDVL